MGRKRVINLPNSATIKCPNCSKSSRIEVQKDSPQFFECRKCRQRIATPINKCCIICSFSNKRCIHSLLIKAHSKGLLVKEQEKKGDSRSREEKIMDKIRGGFEKQKRGN